jgi:hypothetical protein
VRNSSVIVLERIAFSSSSWAQYIAASAREFYALPVCAKKKMKRSNAKNETFIPLADKQRRASTLVPKEKSRLAGTSHTNDNSKGPLSGNDSVAFLLYLDLNGTWSGRIYHALP